MFHSELASIKAIAHYGEFDICRTRLYDADMFFVRSPKRDAVVGFMQMHTSRERLVSGIPQVELCGVKRSLIGKGFGRAMYEAALNKYGKLASDSSLSVGASKTWKKLVMAHGGCLLLKTGQTVAIKGWATDNHGYDIPLVLAKGKKIPLTSLIQNPDSRVSDLAETACYIIAK